MLGENAFIDNHPIETRIGEYRPSFYSAFRRKERLPLAARGKVGSRRLSNAGTVR
jgi:hypothetical protein